MTKPERMTKLEIRTDGARDDATFGIRVSFGFRHSAFVIFFAPVPQQLQGEFRKLVFVGASPTRGSSLRPQAVGEGCPAIARRAKAGYLARECAGFGWQATSPGIGVERHTPVFQTGIEGALPSCPSISGRDAALRRPVGAARQPYLPFPRREIPVPVRTSQAWLRRFNSAFASRPCGRPPR